MNNYAVTVVVEVDAHNEGEAEDIVFELMHQYYSEIKEVKEIG